MVADIFGGSSVGTPEKSDGDSDAASGSEEQKKEPSLLGTSRTACVDSGDS